MATISEPEQHDIVIYCHSVKDFEFRRVDENNAPYIPTSAYCELRSWEGGPLWFEPVCTIDAEGWVKFTIPANADIKAGTALEGVYAVRVTFNGAKYLWLQGNVKYERV